MRSSLKKHLSRPESRRKQRKTFFTKTFYCLGSFCIGLFCLGLHGCGDPVDYGEIPWEDIDVNFRVYPYSLDNMLMATGNSKVFEDQGMWGVFVYHIGYMDEPFVAFDLACPFDCRSNDCQVTYSKEDEAFISRCGQKFSTYTGFCSTVSGYSLFKYNITYAEDGSFFVSK